MRFLRDGESVHREAKRPRDQRWDTLLLTWREEKKLAEGSEEDQLGKPRAKGKKEIVTPSVEHSPQPSNAQS